VAQSAGTQQALAASVAVASTDAAAQDTSATAQVRAARQGAARAGTAREGLARLARARSRGAPTAGSCARTLPARGGARAVPPALVQGELLAPWETHSTPPTRRAPARPTPYYQHQSATHPRPTKPPRRSPRPQPRPSRRALPRALLSPSPWRRLHLPGRLDCRAGVFPRPRERGAPAAQPRGRAN
jgi:hypothetical protein